MIRKWLKKRRNKKILLTLQDAFQFGLSQVQKYGFVDLEKRMKEGLEKVKERIEEERK